MNTLFPETEKKDLKEAPLSLRMRPKTLEEFVGQEEILGEGKLLSRAILSDRVASIIIFGPPGTGKTMLAKAIATEAGVPFLSTSGSEFVEIFVGVGASRVRKLFSQARQYAKAYGACIIFIDEIEVLGRTRVVYDAFGGGQEGNSTLNQLLVSMDGVTDSDAQVVVIGAMNMAEQVLDPALTRPGRFDRQVTVPKPDLAGRQRILQVHTKGITLDKDVDLKVVAQATPGFTGADLANLANESALAAARKNQATVCMADFEEARDKLMMGKERRSMVIPDKEKRTTAFHEAGHALVAALTPGVDPVHKVTIVPRGRALGLTMLLPTEDRYSQHRSQLVGMLSMMMGGRAAEEIIFNHFTTGASNDLERATQVAHKMVCNWGMSERVGPVYLAVGQGEVFLGRDLMKKKRISQSSARLIDQEVKRIVNDAYQQAKSLLQSHLEQLNLVTERLIERETIDGSYILEVLGKPAPA